MTDCFLFFRFWPGFDFDQFHVDDFNAIADDRELFQALDSWARGEIERPEVCRQIEQKAEERGRNLRDALQRRRGVYASRPGRLSGRPIKKIRQAEDQDPLVCRLGASLGWWTKGVLDFCPFGPRVWFYKVLSRKLAKTIVSFLNGRTGVVDYDGNEVEHELRPRFGFVEDATLQIVAQRCINAIRRGEAPDVRGSKAALAMGQKAMAIADEMLEAATTPTPVQAVLAPPATDHATGNTGTNNDGISLHSLPTAEDLRWLSGKLSRIADALDLAGVTPEVHKMMGEVLYKPDRTVLLAGWCDAAVKRGADLQLRLVLKTAAGTLGRLSPVSRRPISPEEASEKLRQCGAKLAEFATNAGAAELPPTTKTEQDGGDEAASPAMPPSCPGCDGPWPENDRRDGRVCPECRSDEGTFAALRISWRTVQNGGAKAESLNGFAEWPGIRHYACELFRHPVFNAGTWERLEGWLLAECVPDRKAMLRLLVPDVLKMLCEAVSAMVEKASTKPSPPAKTAQGEGNGGAGTAPKAPRLSKPADKKPKRGRPVDAATIRRADFAKPLREQGKTWEEIAAAYSKKHPRDIDASADTLRLTFQRQYPEPK